jgi:hypothetical protein
LVCAVVLSAATQTRAAVYLSLDQALALAFPGAERMEKRNFVLTADQKKRIEDLAQAPLGSQLVSVNVGWRGADVMGYALIDVHTVRTVQQGLMVVVTPDGHVGSVRVLAFYEPAEYLPNDRFRRQYEGKQLDANLQLGKGVQAVSGATLSSVATTRAVRRSLAIYQVLIAGAAAGSAPPAGPGGAAAPATLATAMGVAANGAPGAGPSGGPAQAP